MLFITRHFINTNFTILGFIFLQSWDLVFSFLSKSLLLVKPEITHIFSFNENIILNRVKIEKHISSEINAVIIDKKIVWYGGLNPFVENKYDDSIMRINDKSIAENIITELLKES